jgi:ABC-type uncharacterized transport system substrate-binding protein
MVNRRFWFSLLIIPLLFVSAAAAKPVKVTAFLSFDNPLYREALKGFAEGMASAGMSVEKTDVVMDGSENMGAAAGSSDLLLLVGSKAYDAGKKTAGKASLVFNMIFASPSDASLTGAGVTLMVPADKKLAKVKEFLPGRNKIAVVYSAESKPEFDALVAAGASAGVKVTGKQAASAEAFAAAVDSAIATADCFVMLPDTKLYNAQNIKVLLTQCASKKIPVVGLSAVYTKAGAAFSIDYDYYDLGLQTAEAASVYLNAGGKGKGKVLSPRKLKTSVNSVVLKSLGINSGAKADQVFGE